MRSASRNWRAPGADGAPNPLVDLLASANPIFDPHGGFAGALGMFVFFDTSGRRKILLTRLDSVSEPDRAFLVSTAVTSIRPAGW